MRTFIVSLVASATLVLTGCVAFVSAEYDSDWVLSSGSDGQGEWVSGDDGAIRVNINDGQISGQICNNWGGNIAVTGSAVVVSSLYSTEMYCTEPAGIMDREQRFLEDLALITSIELVDGRLRLSGDTVTLEFVAG